MTQENHQQESNMGQSAQAVLDNPAFAEAWRRMRDDLSEAWRHCDVRDREGQVLLLQQAKLCDRLQATLTGMVEQGKLAHSKIRIDGIRDENSIRRGIRAVSGM